MNYLESKTVPPTVPTHIIPWSCLQTRLHEGLSRRLMLVVAVAGSGKTTCLYHFFQSAASFGQRPVWLSLDASDDNPPRFWESFFGALGKLDLGITPMMAPREPRVEASDLDRLTEALGQVATAPFDIFLVIDDYQEIHHPAIHEALMFWIEHMPKNMHLALASRIWPPLSLSNLRGRDQLVEIGSEELFLDYPETKRFLRVIKDIDAPEDEMYSLYELTDGWIAGLQLATSAYRNSGETPLSLVSAQTMRHIREYLLDEVYSQQDKPVREFILKTSILNRLNASLCAEVAGTGTQTPSLDSLARSGLFLIPLDSREKWYRYRSIFANALRCQLDSEAPELVRELYSRASAWSERKGLLDDAIEYALAAEEDDRVIQLFERVMLAALNTLDGELFVLDEARHHRWLHSLPEERYSDDVTFLLLNAWNGFVAGCPKDSMDYLDRAQKSLKSLSDQERTFPGFLIAEEILLAIEAGNANMEGDYRHAIALSQDALTRREGGSAWFKVTLLCLLGEAQGSTGNIDGSMRSYGQARAVGMAFNGIQLAQFCSYEIGKMYCQQGRFDLAAETWQKALAFVGPEGEQRQYSSGLLLTGLGLLQVLQGDVEQAGVLLEQARSILSESENLFCLLKLQIAIASLRQVEGQALDALGIITAAAELALSSYSKIVPRYSVWEAFVYYAKLALSVGDIITAESILQTLRGFLPPNDSYYRIQSDLIEAMILQGKGEQGKALSTLGTVMRKSQEADYRCASTEAQTLRATCLCELGQADAAFIEFTLALDAAEGLHYVAPFMLENASVDELLYRILFERKGKHALPSGRRSFCRDLLDARSARHRPSGIVRAPKKPRFTKREEDVLKLMEQGLSRNEIAEELHISPNTVKTHIRNVYEKLDVNDRASAVRASLHDNG